MTDLERTREFLDSLGIKYEVDVDPCEFKHPRLKSDRNPMFKHTTININPQVLSEKTYPYLDEFGAFFLFDPDGKAVVVGGFE